MNIKKPSRKGLHQSKQKINMIFFTNKNTVYSSEMYVIHIDIYISWNTNLISLNVQEWS